MAVFLGSAPPTMICRHKVVRNKGNIFHVIAAVSGAILHCYVIATTFVLWLLGYLGLEKCLISVTMKMNLNLKDLFIYSRCN